MTNLIIRRIPELQELVSLSGNEYIVAYDPASDTTRKIKASLLQGGTESVTAWVQSETYSQGQIVEWGLKLWKSKVNENQGNFPAENSFWEEVSRSEANGFGVWSPGVFTLNPSLVVRHERLYLLTAPVPFQSINLEDEEFEGKWLKLTQVNHNELAGRTEENGHTMSAITGLLAKLAQLESTLPLTQVRFLRSSQISLFATTYYETLATTGGAPIVNITGSITGTNIATSNIIAQFVGLPVPAGQQFTIERINLDFQANKNATARVVTLFVEFLNMAPDGTLTVLGNSSIVTIEESPNHYNVYISLPTPYIATEGNRAVLRIRGYQSGTGTAAQGVLSIENNTFSRWSFETQGGVGSGHIISDGGTLFPQRDILEFAAGFEVEDTPEATVVRVVDNIVSHIDSANAEKHTTNQIIQELGLLKLNLPANSPLHTILQSIDNFLSGTLNASEIDAGGWAISEKRLAILENTINGIQIQGAALLLDIFAPPGVEASLRDNLGWANETKTLTGDNSTGQLGQTGAMIWLNDAVYAQCTNAILGVSGSATYRRNRAVDVLDPVNNTQDAAIANALDPSYTYPAMTPTGNSTDVGWNLTSQVKVITGRPTRWGMWFIGGINGDGYTYHCFLVNGTTSYWKRTGTPSSISRCIYAATHPNLTTRLLAHNFGTGAYTQVSGDEVTYADQTFYDATTRAYFIKMINGNWEKIR